MSEGDSQITGKIEDFALNLEGFSQRSNNAEEINRKFLESIGTSAPEIRDLILKIEHKLDERADWIKKKDEVTISVDSRIIVPSQEELDRLIRRVKNV